MSTYDPFLVELASLGIPEPILEHRFHPTRRWRFDYAWFDEMIAVEKQGAVYARGRHTRGKGYTNDCAKLNEAQLAGWLVLWATTEQIENGEAAAWVQRAFEARGK